MQDLLHFSSTPTITRRPMPRASRKTLTPNLSLWQTLYNELRAIGYSQKYIAAVSGISVSTIKKLRQSNHRQPTLKTFYRLMTFYCQCLASAEGA